MPDPLFFYLPVQIIPVYNPVYDCKTVENRTIVVCVCSDCGHTWEQSL